MGSVITTPLSVMPLPKSILRPKLLAKIVRWPLFLMPKEKLNSESRLFHVRKGVRSKYKSRAKIVGRNPLFVQSSLIVCGVEDAMRLFGMRNKYEPKV
jgi:hypothetical protein